MCAYWFQCESWSTMWKIEAVGAFEIWRTMPPMSMSRVWA
jgi:hypothetical protein